MATNMENEGSQLNLTEEEKESRITSAARESATGQPVEKPSVKKDWYQTDSFVVITFFLKNLKTEDLEMNITSQSVRCKLLSGTEVYGADPIGLKLLHHICPEQSSWKVLPAKVEVKLKKQECFWWTKLEGDAPPTAPKQPMAAATAPPMPSAAEAATAPIPTYPSSCTQKRDWDRIAQDIKKDEESEKLEGESALNQLFQKIYAEGSDEVKKAMNKSFMESGGTVLSTNWKDVGNKEINVNPPDGMEFKKWDT